MVDIPAGFADLLDDATPATLVFSTLRRDGLPVLSPVWFVTEGSELLMVVDPHALKARHLRRDPRAAAIILAPHEHNRYLQLAGEAAHSPSALCRIFIAAWSGNTNVAHRPHRQPGSR
ncbi:hypothetical protein HC891_20880 [Candidatus Gracilibacteria bacterium]|nr:hypothetical protein [Candidatus Gracilibacteria bacterium]